jgi:type IX secretion system PorP/SprF family membrane protein
MQAPAIYNPAFLSENNSLQFSLNYRNYQLIDDIDYITSLFSFQTPVNYKWGKLNSGTVGISVFDDRLNNGGLYSYTGLAIAYSQPVQISANSTLSVALQTNCYQKRFNLDQYTTGSQWNDYIGYNSSAPIGEDIVREKIYRFSVNTGIYWRLADQAGDTRAYAGGGLFNINRPDESFTNVTSRQLWRYTMQGGYKIYDEGKIKLIPELLFVEQGQQRFISTGLKTGFSFEGVNPYVPLKAGQICITTRYFNSEAMSFGAILDQPYYSFGLSYDFNVNASIPGNSNAFEAFVIIKLNKHEEKPIKKVSNDYYIGQVREFFENKRDTSKKIGHPATIEKQNQETKKPLSLALRRDFKFAFNDATLNDEAKTYLDDLAALLKENKSMTLEIIGHTDDVGSEEGNRIISIQRAQIVADYLISKGIDKNRLKITGKMDKEPLFPNDSPENRAKNRRVEFIISN